MKKAALNLIDETLARHPGLKALKGGVVVALTGTGGGELKNCADILLNVPETETYKIQELHLPLYHLLCACAEIELWG